MALPPNVDSDFTVWASVTTAGGQIALPDTGISLTIPRGAVLKGSVSLYLAVLREDKDRPNLSYKETVLSPVVQCGPPNLPFAKPLILSLPHCARIESPEKWTISIYNSTNPSAEWTNLVTVGQEAITTPISCQVDPHHCHLTTKQLGRFAVVGESCVNQKAVKSIALAAFAPAFHSSTDYTIRVYCIEDTKAAIQGMMQVEEKLRGSLLHAPKSMLLQDGCSNLCLCLEDISPGWKCRPFANYQEIPFHHLWNNRQNHLHCSFQLERLDSLLEAVSCHILVYQRGVQANWQVLRISTDYKKVPQDKLVSPLGPVIHEVTDFEWAERPAEKKPAEPFQPRNLFSNHLMNYIEEVNWRQYQISSGSQNVDAYKLSAKCTSLDLIIQHMTALLKRSDEDGDSPLHIAVYQGNYNMVEDLLSSGTSPNVTNLHGLSPLHICALTGNVSIANMLLSKGAKVNAATREHKCTAFHIACHMNNIDFMDFLRRHGAVDSFMI